MEKKLGRRKSPEPTRNKNINFRVSEKELEKARELCLTDDIRYVDIFLKGLEVLSQK